MSKAGWVVVTLVAIAGCPRGRAPQVDPPTPGPTACAGLPRNEMPRNEMPRNEMPRNGLSALSLEKNHALLGALASGGFDASLDKVVTWIPASDADDPSSTRKLLKYLAACALDPCERATTELVRADGSREPFEVTGELGLCGDAFAAWAAARGQATEKPWRDHAASPGCKQRVTACVLARVNAIGASVRLSMRGDGMTLASEVGVDTIFREHHGTPIHSFASCAKRNITSQEPARNCGWVPRHVGRCVAGPWPRSNDAVPGRVTVAASGRIRICEGVYGCDDPSTGDPTPLLDAAGKALPSPPRYGGWHLRSGTQQVTFDCPSNGPVIDGQQTGYYAVMVDAAIDPKVAVATSATNRYPASEGEVFTYREGAFYGTLFDQPVFPELTNRILIQQQHACYSDVWTEGQALLADRLCANTTALGTCFVNEPGPCDDGRCTPLPEPPRVEAACTAKQATWEPYTTYLNHPCDLSATDETCRSRVNFSKYPVVREQLATRESRRP